MCRETLRFETTNSAVLPSVLLYKLGITNSAKFNISDYTVIYSLIMHNISLICNVYALLEYLNNVLYVYSSPYVRMLFQA